MSPPRPPRRGRRRNVVGAEAHDVAHAPPRRPRLPSSDCMPSSAPPPSSPSRGQPPRQRRLAASLSSLRSKADSCRSSRRPPLPPLLLRLCLLRRPPPSSPPGLGSLRRPVAAGGPRRCAWSRRTPAGRRARGTPRCCAAPWRPWGGTCAGGRSAVAPQQALAGPLGALLHEAPLVQRQVVLPELLLGVLQAALRLWRKPTNFLTSHWMTGSVGQSCPGSGSPATGTGTASRASRG